MGALLNRQDCGVPERPVLHSTTWQHLGQISGAGFWLSAGVIPNWKSTPCELLRRRIGFLRLCKFVRTASTLRFRFHSWQEIGLLSFWLLIFLRALPRQIRWRVIDFAASGFVYFFDERCAVIALGIA